MSITGSPIFPYLPGGTPGGVIYLGADGREKDDPTGLFYDEIDGFLGIGTPIPDAFVSVVGDLGPLVPLATFNNSTPGGDAFAFFNDPTGDGAGFGWVGGAGAVFGAFGPDPLILSTDSTPRWFVDGVDGHLLADGDNLYDIGAIASERPKEVHVATSVHTPLLHGDGTSLGLSGDAGSPTWILDAFGSLLPTSPSVYGIGSVAFPVSLLDTDQIRLNVQQTYPADVTPFFLNDDSTTAGATGGGQFFFTGAGGPADFTLGQSGGQGGLWEVLGNKGGDSDAVFSAGDGGHIQLTAGDAGTDFGGGGASGGSVTLNAGAGTGFGDGSIALGNIRASDVTLGNAAMTGSVRADGPASHATYDTFDAIAAPAGPGAGHARLYAKTMAGTTSLFYKNSAGVEVGPLT